MNNNTIECLITKLDLYARNNLSEYRYAHSRRTALFAEALAKRYGCTIRQQRLCFLAGIAHDMCKEKPIEALRDLISRDGKRITALERSNTELLHGRAAAVLLRETYGITKKSLLRAVSEHTVCSAKFDAVGKILYIADKIEPGRIQCAYLRDKVAALPLDSLFFEVVYEVLCFIEKKGGTVHPHTQKVYRYLLARYARSNPYG
ncbi:MAG: bis(5'-nucleosyl)-tetraphosphatase (symmetrical) YqeK [Treponema sp.]